ncbi:MAG: hypothetical protein ACYC3L_11070 [Gemmatimonadaceae bacterium]
MMHQARCRGVFVLLRWTGRVDTEAQITIRDTTISTSVVGGHPVKMTYFDIKDRLPQRDGTACAWS